MRAKPRLQQRSDLVARLEALAFAGETDAEAQAEFLELHLQSRRRPQPVPLPIGQPDHHHAPPIGGFEVLTVGAIQCIAVIRAVDPVDHDFAENAKMAEHGERDVF